MKKTLGVVFIILAKIALAEPYGDYLTWVGFEAGNGTHAEYSLFFGAFSGESGGEFSRTGLFGVNAGFGAYDLYSCHGFGFRSLDNSECLKDVVAIGRSSGRDSVNLTNCFFVGANAGRGITNVEDRTYIGGQFYADRASGEFYIRPTPGSDLDALTYSKGTLRLGGKVVATSADGIASPSTSTAASNAVVSIIQDRIDNQPYVRGTPIYYKDKNGSAMERYQARGYFTLDGEAVGYVVGSDLDGMGYWRVNSNISLYMLQPGTYQIIEFLPPPDFLSEDFTLSEANNYTAIVGGHTIVGYVPHNLARESQIPLNTSELENDGADGKHPFITNGSFVELPKTVADRGVAFTNKHGGVQNAAVVIGVGAVGALSVADTVRAPSNTLLRSVSVAIGPGAYAKQSGTVAQQIAIGWQSRALKAHDIAIGSGPTHSDERFMSDSTSEKSIGDSAEAYGGESIAMSYGAKAAGSKSIALGSRSVAMATGAVQIGMGTNTAANTLQFRGYQLLDAEGQIPTSRLAAAVASMAGGMLDGIERAVRPGNTTAICNGLDVDTSGHPVIEPRLDGISEVEIQPDTNGVYAAGTEVEVMPPMGSRNFDIVLREIPQFVGVTNGVEYALPPENNFLLSFAELHEPRRVETWCDPSIGYTNGLMVVLTNAPCIVKVREPSTNRLYCVVKPWSVAADL